MSTPQERIGDRLEWLKRQNNEHLANDALLHRLAGGIELQHTAPIDLFFETEPRWKCPCCSRSKDECVRLDKHGKLLLGIVVHHDHAEGYAKEYLRSKGADIRDRFWHPRLGQVKELLQRFRRTPICQGCNERDVELKRLVNAPPLFSFSPDDMHAINVAAYLADGFDEAALHRVYAEALAEHEANCEDVRALLDAMLKRREEAA